MARKKRAAPIAANAAKPPITLPAITPALFFFELAAADGVAVFVPVGVGTLPAVGIVDVALVELLELLELLELDELVDEELLELVVELEVVLPLLELEDIVVDGADVGVNCIPVNTCCRSKLAGWPLNVVSTVVAKLDFPHPH